MVRIFKIIIRIFGIFICIWEYYSVFVTGKLSIFDSIVVSDWSMYVLPLTAPILAEWCIVTFSMAKKEIDKQKNS